MLAGDKHSSLLIRFVSNEETEVSRIESLSLHFLHNQEA
jgi:hypothetical protein